MQALTIEKYSKEKFHQFINQLFSDLDDEIQKSCVLDTITIEARKMNEQITEHAIRKIKGKAI